MTFKTGVIIMLFGVVLGVLQAQGPTGELRVEVKDPSGAAMQAAGRLGERSFETDAQGVYTFSNLAPGRYRLEVSRNGFVAQSVALDVTAGAAITRTVTMALAAQASRIDVVEATPLPG